MPGDVKEIIRPETQRQHRYYLRTFATHSCTDDVPCRSLQVDEIHVTSTGRNLRDATRRSCPDPRAHHLGEPQQVLESKWRTPAPRHYRGVRWRKVRPANGNRPDRAVGPLHRDPVFSPEGLGHQEREAGAPEWMERVGNPNLWCFNSTGSILQL